MMNFKIPPIFNGYSPISDERKYHIKVSIYIAGIVIFVVAILFMGYILFIKGYNEDTGDMDTSSGGSIELIDDQKRRIENRFIRSIDSDALSEEHQQTIEDGFDTIDKQIPTETEQQGIIEQFNKKLIN